MPRFLLRRRQLMSNLTLTPTNHTTNNPCPDFCDPACDNFEECYTFPDAGYPLPPLPPPLPPFTVVVSPVTTTATTTQGAHVSPVVIVIVVVLASIFLLFSYYAVVIKYCTFWNRRAHEELPRSDSDLGGSRGRDALVQENGDHDPMVVDHPIWLISTIGLHQSVINAITMVRYKRGDGLIDGSDCSVCLCEFQEGETLRLLPKCSHAFHIDCIDTWLRSHTNCPLCRAAVVANSGRQSLASNEPSFGHSRRVELFNPAVDLDSSDVELGRPQTGNNSSRVVEIGDNASNVAHNDHTNNKAEAGFNSIIIRSFSMDYFRGSNFHNNLNSGLTREMDSSSSSSRPQPLRPCPCPMKRSYSWSGRVFWSSCSQNNSSRDISP